MALRVIGSNCLMSKAQRIPYELLSKFVGVRDFQVLCSEVVLFNDFLQWNIARLPERVNVVLGGFEKVWERKDDFLFWHLRGVVVVGVRGHDLVVVLHLLFEIFLIRFSAEMTFHDVGKVFGTHDVRPFVDDFEFSGVIDVGSVVGADCKFAGILDAFDQVGKQVVLEKGLDNIIGETLVLLVQCVIAY